MATAPAGKPAPKAKPLTPAQNIARGEAAGLIPTPRRAKPKAKVAKRPKANRANTPMVKKVRKIERSTAMY